MPPRLGQRAAQELEDRDYRCYELEAVGTQYENLAQRWESTAKETYLQARRHMTDNARYLGKTEQQMMQFKAELEAANHSLENESQVF